MSVVCAKVTKNRIIIGADSAITLGQTQEEYTKIKKVNGMIVGGVGYSQELGMFLLFCKTTKPRTASEDGVMDFISQFFDWAVAKTRNPKFSINNSYLLVFDKKLFSINNGFDIREITEHAALGAGRDYALATLSLGKSVQQSLKVACKLSIYCGEPISVMEVRK